MPGGAGGPRHPARPARPCTRWPGIRVSPVPRQGTADGYGHAGQSRL